MCLIAFAWRAHPQWPLVVVANRDEYYKRPTQAAHWWSEHPDIFAGRDLEAGGTWMGISRNGRFAALTNIRDPKRVRSNATSRGKLVSDYLKSSLSPAEYTENALRHAAEYNGFNLLLGRRDELYYCNNRESVSRALAPGVYALSNATLEIEWPKTLGAREKLSTWLEQAGERSTLAGLLHDQQPADDGQLPDTGISRDLEKALSSEYIELPDYGTRSSTGLLVNGVTGQAQITELAFKPANRIDTVVERFW